jgi:hypothetical protein
MSKSELETVDCKEMFELALSAMKRVTEMVNEGKLNNFNLQCLNFLDNFLKSWLQCFQNFR